MNKRLLKFFFFLLILIILLYNPLSARFFTFIMAISFNLDVDNYYQLIAAESSFRCLAFSHKKAIGLGQLKKSTAKYIQPGIPTVCIWIPPVNLYISAKYTKYLLEKYKNNWSLALAAYNWGETNVDKRIKNLKIIPGKNYSEMFRDIPETYAYLKKILNEK